MSIPTVSLLKLALMTKNPAGGFGIPILLWGDPGTAKSAMVEQAAESLGLHCKVLSPSEHGDGAFGVTPVPVGTPGDVRSLRIGYPAPEWVDEFEDDGNGAGVLFVDELNTPAAQHLFGPMLALLHARRIAGRQLPNRVRVVGAANPIDSAAGGLELPQSLANRMGHFYGVPPTQAEWASFLLSGQGASLTTSNLATEEARVEGLWGAAYARAASEVAAFTKARPELLHKKPEVMDPKGGTAWPSRRSWHLATYALTGCAIHGLSEYADEIVAGFVGSAAATEFCAYRRALDLPDFEHLLDGKIAWKYDPHRLDVGMAVCSGAASLVATSAKDHPLRTARTLAMWKVLAPISSIAPDITFDGASILCKAHLESLTPEIDLASAPVRNSIWPLQQAMKA